MLDLQNKMLQAGVLRAIKHGGIVGDVLTFLDIVLLWTSSKEVIFGSFQTVLGIKF